MPYKIKDRIVSRDEFIYHIAGKHVGKLILERGYSFDLGIPGAVFRQENARQALKIDDLLSPPPGDAGLSSRGIIGRNTAPPALVARRARSIDVTQHRKNEELREKAHNRLRSDFAPNGIVKPETYGSLHSLISFIEHEIGRRAVRAYSRSDAIRERLAVPIAEARNLERLTSEQIHELTIIRLAWEEIAEGATMSRAHLRLEQLCKRAPFMHRSAWDAAAEGIRILLDFREPELLVAEELEARLVVAKQLRRAAALGEDFPPFGEPHALPKRMEVGEILFLEDIRTAEPGYSFYEDLPDTLSGFAEWAAERLLTRNMSPIDPQSLERRLRESAHWQKVGRGKTATPGSVRRLAEGLERDFRDWSTRFE